MRGKKKRRLSRKPLSLLSSLFIRLLDPSTSNLSRHDWKASSRNWFHRSRREITRLFSIARGAIPKIRDAREVAPFILLVNCQDTEKVYRKKGRIYCLFSLGSVFERRQISRSKVSYYRRESFFDRVIKMWDNDNKITIESRRSVYTMTLARF